MGAADYAVGCLLVKRNSYKDNGRYLTLKRFLREKKKEIFREETLWYSIARSLGEIKDSRGFEDLVVALKDENGAVRLAINH